jgi:hypothetical protein
MEGHKGGVIPAHQNARLEARRSSTLACTRAKPMLQQCRWMWESCCAGRPDRRGAD